MRTSVPDFLSCDWGTTSFRLRLVCGNTGAILREHREPAGIKSLHAEIGDKVKGALREQVFVNFLRNQVESLLGEPRQGVSSIPLIISGMASSTIGWRELPYAPAPFALDGSGLRIEAIDWPSPLQVGKTFMVSGVATARDMMRGEETEIIGLMADSALDRFRGNALLVLPGTHAKHVVIENGAVIDFRTFMTGELFEVLRRHSILRASVEGGHLAPGEEEAAVDIDAFREGAAWQKRIGLSAALFRVRTRAVLDGCPPPRNLSFLSGVLIGAEVAAISRSTNCATVIAANFRMAGLYRAACEAAQWPSESYLIIPPQRVEHASTAGHAQLLQRFG